MKPSKLPAHYQDLDAPVFIWNKIHQGGDLSWLLIKRKKLNDSLKEQLTKVWENIYNQFFKRFGWSDEFTEITNKEVEIGIMKCDLLISKDRILLTHIEIAEYQLKEMRKATMKGSFQQSKQAIERHYKFQINAHQTSIEDFYSYIESLKKK